MIKKFRIELVVLAILILNVFVSYNIDIGLYNYFNDLNKSVQQIYFKKFFEQITVLGDSIWYFSFSIIVAFMGFVLKGKKLFNKYKLLLDELLSFSILLFFSVLFSGILAQVLKHLVGRARPNHTFLDKNIGFDFFNLDSSFHSFPSGHATTIFAVALTLSYFIPRLKFLFISLALVISFSRVVIGVHFFTDIVGGAAVAYLTFKLARLLLVDKHKLVKKQIVKSQMSLFTNNKIYFSFFIVGLVMLVFTIAPSIDIYLSSLFYFGEKQFLLQSYYDITIFFRKVFLRAIIIYVLIFPIISLWLPIQQLFFNFKFSIRSVVFLWISGLFNLLILVNLLLKDFWGRARPGEILELGGEQSFTPWFSFSNNCATNCSFVSGDAAIGFAVISLYFITKKEVYFWLSLIFGCLLGSIRMMEGGHFLSDVVMAGFIIYIAYFIQTKLFYKHA